MSANELRKAAATLRGRASAAVRGPWSPEPIYDLRVWSDAYDDREVCAVEQGENPEADLRYIATMHPGVGLVLADLLDALAMRVEQIADALPPSKEIAERVGMSGVPGSMSALRLARLINGGAE